MALTDVKVRNTKPGEKPIKISDGEGMYLLVTPQGGKCWRLKYRFDGKEKVLALGTYPEVLLAEAREKRAVARRQLSHGVDPGAIRRAEKAAQVARAADSFEIVAREWWERFRHTWTDGHALTILARLDQNIFPWLGERPIEEIEAPDLLAALRRVEARGALETAHRVSTICGQVFRYAIATGRAKRNVAADLKGAIPPATVSSHAAITEPKEVALLLRDIDAYRGSFVVKCALRLAPLVFVRPGELRQAEWSEIDLEAQQWNIPAQRMKMKTAHIVPLSAQALEVLRELHPFTGTVVTYFLPRDPSSAACPTTR